MMYSYGSDPNQSVSSDDPSAKAPFNITEGLMGRIMDIDGYPVRGALIQPQSLDDPSPPIPDIAILSDNDGWYQWRLFPGAYEISVFAERYQTATRRIIIKAGQVINVDLILKPAP